MTDNGQLYSVKHNDNGEGNDSFSVIKFFFSNWYVFGYSTFSCFTGNQPFLRTLCSSFSTFCVYICRLPTRSCRVSSGLFWRLLAVSYRARSSRQPAVINLTDADWFMWRIRIIWAVYSSAVQATEKARPPQSAVIITVLFTVGCFFYRMSSLSSCWIIIIDGLLSD